MAEKEGNIHIKKREVLLCNEKKPYTKSTNRLVHHNMANSVHTHITTEKNGQALNMQAHVQTCSWKYKWTTSRQAIRNSHALRRGRGKDHAHTPAHQYITAAQQTEKDTPHTSIHTNMPLEIPQNNKPDRTKEKRNEERR